MRVAFDRLRLSGTLQESLAENPRATVDALIRWWAASRPHDMRATRDAIIRKVRGAMAELAVKEAEPAA